MIASSYRECDGRSRRAFTLIELLITITIIGMMASMVLFAAYSAQETAKVAKTKALVAKLDQIIKSRWDAYKTRRVAIQGEPFQDLNGNGVYDSGEPFTDLNGNGSWDNFIPSTPPTLIPKSRLDGLRDLMRMEMPERWSDICNVNVATNRATGTAATPFNVRASSVWNGYVRKVQAAASAGKPATLEHQNAECLYLIVMSAISEEGDAREVFKPDDVGDLDGDGFPEFRDAWGQPIKFLRWPSGFQLSELQVVARVNATGAGPNQVQLTGALNNDPGAYLGGAIISIDPATKAFSPTNAAHVVSYVPASGLTPATITYSGTATFNGPVAIMAPDPFDVLGIYGQGTVGVAAPSFALYPLIYSAGPDKAYGIVSDGTPPLGATMASLNPFAILPGPPTEMVGAARDIPGEPSGAWLDNVHNHLLSTR